MCTSPRSCSQAPRARVAFSTQVSFWVTGRPNPWVTIKIDCINHHDVFLVPESAAAAAWGWLQPCASAVTARAAVRAARGVHLPSRSALPAGWNPTNGLLQFEVAGRDYCIGKFAEVERARQAVALLDQVRPLVAHSPDCRPDDWAAKHELLTAAVGRAVAMGDNFRCSSVTCDGFADSNGGATATATTRRRQGVGDGASDANAATTTAAAAAAEAAAADDDDDDNDDDDNGDGGGDDDDDDDDDDARAHDGARLDVHTSCAFPRCQRRHPGARRREKSKYRRI